MTTSSNEETRIRARGRGPLSAVRGSQLLIAGLIVAGVGIAVATVTSSSKRHEVTIPQGTSVVGALDRTISTKTSDVGQSVRLRTVSPLDLGDDRVIPGGMWIYGEVTHARGGGRIAGAPELTIRFTRLEAGGEEHRVDIQPFRVRGRDDLKESIAEIAGGTVAGAIVGAVAGDAVKGAVIGAAAGTGVAIATKGNQIVLPAGQRIRIRLLEAVTVSYRLDPAARSEKRRVGG